MPVTNWSMKLLLAVGIGLGLLMLVIVSLSLLLRVPFVQEKVRSQVQFKIEARINQEVHIGSVGLDLLRRSFKMSNIRVSPRGKPDDPPLLVVDAAAFYPDPWELLRLRLRLNRILLSGPKVRIQPFRSKTAPGQSKGLTPGTLSLPLGIAHFEVRDGEVIWGIEGKRITLSGLQGHIRASGKQIEGSVDTAEMKFETGRMSLIVTDFGLGATVQGENLQINRLRLTAMESVLRGQGRIENILKDPAIDLTVNAKGKVEDLFPRKPPVSLAGNFRINGKITGPIANPRFAGRAEVGQGKVELVDIVGMTLAVNGDRERLRLTQLNVQGVEGTLTGDMTLTWKNLQYHLNLLGEGVNLTRILRPIAGNATVGGRTAMEAHVVGEGTNLSKVKGQIKVDVEDFHLLKRPEERGHVRISLEGDGDRVHIRELNAALAQTNLNANGTLKPGEQLKMEVTAQTSKLEQIAGLFGSKPHQLAGEAKFKGQLSGPLGDPVLKGDLQWSNATLLGVALDRVHGPIELVLTKRTLNSPTVEATRQNLHGKFDVGLTLLRKPPDRKLKLKQDLKLRIKGEIEGPWKEYLGVFIKKTSKETLPVTGTMQLKAGIRGIANELIGQGELVVTKGGLLGVPFDRAEATVHLKDRKVSLQGVKIHQGSGSMTGKWEISFDGLTRWEFKSTPLSIQGLAFLGNTPVTGTAEILHATGEGPLGLEQISSKLNFRDLSYRSVDLGKGEGTITWDGFKQRSTGHLVLPESGYSFRGNLSTEAEFPFKGTLTLERGDLGSILRITKSDLPTQLSGIGSGEIRISARLKEIAIDHIGVDLRTAKIEIPGHSFQTTARTTLDFKDGQLTIPPMTLKGEDMDMTIGGTIGEDINLTMRGTAPIALASILSPQVSGGKGLTKFDMAVQGPRELPRYHGRIATTDSSLTLRGHPEPIEKLQGEIRFTESSAESPGLEAQWGGGKLRATLQGQREQNGWKWPIEYSLTDARLERILVTKTDKELPGLATGELQSNGTLNFTTGPDLEWLSTLEGKVHLKAVNGNILRSFVLERILTAINVTGLFHKGPRGKGMAYDEVSAIFQLDKGIAKTDNLQLRSPSLRAGGSGQLDLVKRTCDAHIAVQPLQLTDRVVRAASNLPLLRHLGVGSFLFGKDQSILVVAYHVHGPLAKLQLDHIPTRGIQGGVLGVFEQTLGLPANLFMRSGDEVEEVLDPQRQKGETDNSP